MATLMYLLHPDSKTVYNYGEMGSAGTKLYVYDEELFHRFLLEHHGTLIHLCEDNEEAYDPAYKDWEI